MSLRATHPATILLIVCTAQFMLLIDDTIVNVALPSIASDLGLDERSLSWVPNAYLLMFGGFLLIGGRLADLLGRRRMLIGSTALFVAASAACGAASSDGVLVAARGIQGFAGAFLSPAALSILLATYTDPKGRGRALALWGALTGLGASTGVLLGGLLTDLASWHWIFWVNLPIGVAAMAAAWRFVPAGERHASTRAPGFVGAALGTTGLLTFVYTVIEASDRGWTSRASFVGFALTAALAIAFVVVESRSAHPLVPAALLRQPNVVLGNVFMFIAAAGLIAMFFFVSLFMQLVWDWSPLRAGLAWLPFSATLMLVSGITSAIIVRINAIVFLAAGVIVAATGMLMMANVGAADSYASSLLPAQLVLASGFGLAFVPLLGIATNGVPGHISGIASGLLTSSQQIGGAVGVAVLVTIASTITDNRIADGVSARAALADGFQTSLTVQAVLLASTALIAGLLALTARDSGRLDAVPLPA